MNNKYDSVSVPSSTPTIVNSLTVPARGGYSFKGLIIWSEVDCEITVKFNLDTIAGGRICGAQQTLFLNFEASPYGMLAQDIVVVFAEQQDTAPHIVNSTILMEQL